MKNIQRNAVKINSKLDCVGEEWASFAHELTLWVLNNLINRNNAFGQYLSKNCRSAKRKAVTKRGNLSKATLIKHFYGESQGALVGIHAISPEHTCRWIAIDIDQHGEKCRDRHLANRKAAIELYRRLRKMGFKPLLISSNGRGGYHLWVVFDRPVPSLRAYQFAQWLIKDWNELGLQEKPEAFPKQSKLTAKCRLGNWLRLPGLHHTLRHFSQVFNGKRWLAGRAAIDTILAVNGQSEACIPSEALSWVPPTKAERQPKQVLDNIPPSRPISPLDLVLVQLDNVVPCGDQWSARCPAHNDRHNSLSIGEGQDGRVLIHCHAGCEFEDIADSLNLPIASFFSQQSALRRVRRVRPPRQFRSMGREASE